METRIAHPDREREPDRSKSAREAVFVLVVEPDAGLRAQVQALVAEEGHHCETAGTPEQAATLLQLQRYDVVMSRLDGNPDGVLSDLARDLVENRKDSILIVMTDREEPREVRLGLELGAFGFLSRPINAHELAFVLRNALRQRRLQQEGRAFSHRMQQEVMRQTKELLNTIQRLERTEMRIRRSQEETIYRLARAAEYRDSETGLHLQRMSQYSAILARKSGLDLERAELVRIASPMHDIGKIGIADTILYKNGKHSPEEFEEMKQHARIGNEILTGSHSELLDLAALIAWTHHEKFDGSGYPRGLAGPAIPFEGRVVTIADVFDALTSKRVYKPAFPVEEAMRMMNEGRAKHFDPGLLDLFWDAMDQVLDVRERFKDPEPH
jgi:putative two-component system response regulator